MNEETKKYLMGKWYWFVIAFILIIASIWIALPSTEYGVETVSIHGSYTDTKPQQTQPIHTGTANYTGYGLSSTVFDIFGDMMKLIITIIAFGTLLTILIAISYTVYTAYKGGFGGWR